MTRRSLERVIAISTKATCPGIDFEQPVDGLGLEAGGLFHAFGRPASRSA